MSNCGSHTTITNTITPPLPQQPLATTSPRYHHSRRRRQRHNITTHITTNTTHITTANTSTSTVARNHLRPPLPNTPIKTNPLSHQHNQHLHRQHDHRRKNIAATRTITTPRNHHQKNTTIHHSTTSPTLPTSATQAEIAKRIRTSSNHTRLSATAATSSLAKHSSTANHLEMVNSNSSLDFMLPVKRPTTAMVLEVDLESSSLFKKHQSFVSTVTSAPEKRLGIDGQRGR